MHLSELENLNLLVLEDKTAKLAELQRDHAAVVQNYQLAQGKRSTTEYRQAESNER
ncbi:MAG: hypothetical protein F6K04_21045 [Leptolyngbya sp. SIO4C5]|nr:hypothetical protein [Leptolyngbya sp. SIO4C5]